MEFVIYGIGELYNLYYACPLLKIVLFGTTNHILFL